MRRAPPVAAGSTGDGSMGLTTTAISSHQPATRTASPIAGALNVAWRARNDRAAMGHLSRPAYVPPGAIGSDLRHISQKLGHAVARQRGRAHSRPGARVANQPTPAPAGPRSHGGVLTVYHAAVVS